MNLLCLFVGHELIAKADQQTKRKYAACLRCDFASVGITTGPPEDVKPKARILRLPWVTRKARAA